MKDPPFYFVFDTRALQLPGMLRESGVAGFVFMLQGGFVVFVPLFERFGCRADVYIYIYFFFFGENTLGECRINISKIERRKRGTTREKNDHRNPAGNRTQDYSLSGRLLFQLSYWARSDSDQITEPPSPTPAERMKER